MAKQFPHISDKIRTFINEQKIFFVGTATSDADSRVNISPKGMDAFRVLGKNRVAWLNVTGSGNETAAHVQANSRMTIMFAAFEGSPMILRLYGQATAVHKNDAAWDTLYTEFPDMAGARQIFDVSVDLVQTSCGMAVPFFDYVEEREQLSQWAEKQGDAGIQRYWEKKNQTSIDGAPTGILEKNLPTDAP